MTTEMTANNQEMTTLMERLIDAETALRNAEYRAELTQRFTDKEAEMNTDYGPIYEALAKAQAEFFESVTLN